MTEADYEVHELRELVSFKELSQAALLRKHGPNCLQEGKHLCDATLQLDVCVIQLCLLPLFFLSEEHSFEIEGLEIDQSLQTQIPAHLRHLELFAVIRKYESVKVAEYENEELCDEPTLLHECQIFLVCQTLCGKATQ